MEKNFTKYLFSQVSETLGNAYFRKFSPEPSTVPQAEPTGLHSDRFCHDATPLSVQRANYHNVNKKTLDSVPRSSFISDIYFFQ